MRWNPAPAQLLLNHDQSSSPWLNLECGVKWNLALVGFGVLWGRNADELAGFNGRGPYRIVTIADELLGRMTLCGTGQWRTYKNYAVHLDINMVHSILQNINKPLNRCIHLKAYQLCDRSVLVFPFCFLLPSPPSPEYHGMFTFSTFNTQS